MLIARSVGPVMFALRDTTVRRTRGVPQGFSVGPVLFGRRGNAPRRPDKMYHYPGHDLYQRLGIVMG
jgi:hypothetical protein